jgi:DNA polymerase-3 subunit beta
MADSLAFSVSVKSLRAALATIAPCVTNRSPKDVLKCCKIAASAGSLQVEGNDMEKSARATVADTDVLTPGVVLLPFSSLRAMVESLAGDIVSIHANSTKAKLVGERAQFSLGLTDPSLFPSMQQETATWKISTQSEALSKTLSALAPFCRGDARKPVMDGMLIEREAGELHVVGGSPGMIAVQRLAATSESSVAIVVPPASCKALAAMLGEGPVEICGSDRLLMAETPSGRFACRLMEGKYPKWRSILPGKSSASVTVVAGPMLDAVDQSMLAAQDDKASLPHVNFEIQNGSIRLSARSDDGLSSSVELPVESGDLSQSLAFNGNMLRLIFRTYSQEHAVSLEFHDGDSSVNIAQCGDLRILFTGLEPERKP